jgi:hypothetical protein
MEKLTLKPNWTLLLITATVMCLVVGLVLSDPQPANADALDSEGPERKALISISYTTYEWWLLTWSDS